MKRLIATLGIGACLLGVSVAGAVDTKDTWITAKAKVALLTADDVSVTAINVDTKDGNVTLHGKVKTGAEKSRAEAAVKKLDGVKSVKNLLQVVPDAFKDATEVADATVKDKVETALKADASLRDVKVASVNKGVVLLSGKAASVDHELRAVEAARAIAGVRRVSSEIQVQATGASE